MLKRLTFLTTTFSQVKWLWNKFFFLANHLGVCVWGVAVGIQIQNPRETYYPTSLVKQATNRQAAEGWTPQAVKNGVYTK